MSDIGRCKGKAKTGTRAQTFSNYFQASVLKHIRFRQQAACYRSVPWIQAYLILKFSDNTFDSFNNLHSSHLSHIHLVEPPIFS